MKLVYIANAKMPHNRAHSIQVAKMVEAFNKRIKTTLITPLKFNSSRELTYSSYNIKSKFKIVYIPSLDFIFLNLGIIFFYLQSLTFSINAVIYSLFIKKDIYYTRDVFSAFFLYLSRFIHGKRVFYEIHGEPTRFETLFARLTLKHVDGLIVLNKYLAEYYNNYNNKMLIAHDGFDKNMFLPNHDKDALRAKLNLDKNKKIVMYSGHLYKHKGIYTLLDSAKFLPQDFIIYILGGTKLDILDVKKYINLNSISNTVILGHVRYSIVSQYISSADILVLPNSSKSKFSNLYTSPLKLFEYMASGKIVVSSDIPSSREILNKDNSILVAPDNPKALAEGIKKAASKKYYKIAAQAKKEASIYSWDERASNILKLMTES